ncbi:MAG: hypothetical protein PHY95_01050 [Candidatus ainarchaeum sp.]|nr:hypothetical protein [Candidatus ainarchaeum sp.]
MALEKVVEEKKPSSILSLIHMGLDSYDDIFSDFDPSPYSERLLSEDFVLEAKRRYAEKRGGGLELRFSLPEALRSAKTETLIKRRLRNYFHAKVKEGEAEIARNRLRGAIYFAAGFGVLLFVAMAPQIEPITGIARFLDILLVPVGWFGMFDGVELLVDSPRKFEKEIRFNRKLAEASYTFFSEEELVKVMEDNSPEAKAPEKPKEEKPKAGEKPKAEEKPAEAKKGPEKKA